MANNGDDKDRFNRKEKERERRRDLSNAFEELTHVLFELDPAAGRVSSKKSYLEVVKRATMTLQNLKQSNAELRHQMSETKVDNGGKQQEARLLIVPNMYPGEYGTASGRHHSMDTSFEGPAPPLPDGINNNDNRSTFAGHSYPPPPYYMTSNIALQHPAFPMAFPYFSSTPDIHYMGDPFPPSEPRDIFTAEENPSPESAPSDELDWQPIPCPERVNLSHDSFSTDDDCDSMVSEINESW